MIIGVTGRNGSGKDTFAQILAQKGFLHHSLSNFLREEAKRRKQENITTEYLRNLGEELRKANGAGALAKLALQNIKESQNYVITSIRNPGEVEEFRKHDNFILVNLAASPKIRYERMKARANIENSQFLKTFADFEELERQDESTNPLQLQTNKVIQMADITIENEEGEEELKNKLTNLIETYSKH